MGNNSTKKYKNLQPLSAFVNTITLSQNGSLTGNTCATGCRPSDSCNTYKFIVDYSKAIYSNDFNGIKNLSVENLFNLGVIQSVTSTLQYHFSVCGGTCGTELNFNYSISYLDKDKKQDSATCFVSGNMLGGAGNVGWPNSCEINNSGLSPISSVSASASDSGGCENYGLGAVSYTFTTTIIVDMKKFCKGSAFDDNVCINYCNYSENSTDCFNNALDYCFTKQNNNYPILDSNGHCNTFISSYINGVNNVQLGNIDNKLKTLCSSEGITPQNYIAQSQYTDLCSCHLDDSIYTNYYNSLTKQIPALLYSGEGSTKCLFPQCNVSKFKSSDMRGVSACPSIQCIQSASLNLSNNGTVNGNVNISQDSQCVSYLNNSGGQTGSGSIAPPVSTKCSSDSDCSGGQVCNTSVGVCETKSNTLLIGLSIGGAIFGLLFIIGIITLILYGRKSKNQ